MVDDFMVCVDRIIASACFETVNGGVGGGVRVEGSENVCTVANSGGGGGGGEGCSKKEGGMIIKGGGVVVECRICQEEDEEHAMEAPCACNGTLKVFFAFSLFKKKIVFSSSFLLVLTSGYLWVSAFSDSLPLFSVLMVLCCFGSFLLAFKLLGIFWSEHFLILLVCISFQ